MPLDIIEKPKRERSQVWSQLAVIFAMLAVLALILRYVFVYGVEHFGLDADVFTMFYLLKIPMALGVVVLFCLAAALFDMVIYGETMKLIGQSALPAAIFYGLWFVGLGLALAAVFG